MWRPSILWWSASLSALAARVGRNNIVCISRDGVLTNQQLPCRYSSGVAKKPCKESLEESSMEMCERNPLNPGYVGSLLNFAPPESLYFSNLRGNGAHIPGLHQLSYNRRDVCTLPWTSASSSCAPGAAATAAAAPQSHRAFSGYCPPFLSNSGSLSSAASGGLVKTHTDDSARCFLKAEEEAARSDDVYAGEHGVAGERGYSELDGRSHGSAAQLDPDSADPLHVNGGKRDQTPIHPSSSHTCSRATFPEGKYMLYAFTKVN